jgi:general secretion pathway protein J
VKRSSGFTLIELIIGMTLLGFILALLFGGFRLASNSWNAVEDRAERSADEQAGRALVRQLITYAQPLHSKQLTDKRLSFAGESGVLRMTTALGQIGLRVVELAVERDDAAVESPTRRAGVRLVLRHGPLAYDNKSLIEAELSEPGHHLLTGLEAITFSYFGIEKPDAPPRWHEKWLDSEKFPRLVRVHLVPRNSNPIDLDITPMASGERKAIVRIVAGPE